LPCLEQSTLFRTVPSCPGFFPPLQRHLRLTGERRASGRERERPSDASVLLAPLNPIPPPPLRMIDFQSEILS
jgi:hypothetical protein